MKEWFDGLKEWGNGLVKEFNLNFIKGDKWTWLTDGLLNTLLITFFAVIIGILRYRRFVRPLYIRSE